MDAFLQTSGFWWPALLVALGWYFGRRAERKHLQNLQKAEADLAFVRASNECAFVEDSLVEPFLVVGCVVVAQDHFKNLIAAVLSFFGKNLTVYESLLDRARREALVRAKRQAADRGADGLYGLRFEASDIEQGVEVIAYATAIKRR